MSDRSEWFYAAGGKAAGPFSARELRQAAASGKLAPDDMVWNATNPRKVPAKRINGLFNMSAPATQARNPAPMVQTRGQASPNRELGYGRFVRDYFREVRGPWALGVAVGLFCWPVLSFLKPRIGMAAIFWTAVAALCCSLLWLTIFFLQKSKSYWLDRQRSLPASAKGLFGFAGYQTWCLFVATLPLVGAEYFSPDRGLLTTAVASLRKDQARWLRLDVADEPTEVEVAGVSPAGTNAIADDEKEKPQAAATAAQDDDAPPEKDAPADNEQPRSLAD